MRREEYSKTEDGSMVENVEKFFALYAADEALRERVREAELSYPGSLEIREAVAEAVLLPIAAELGLPFTVKDLRAYETRVKMRALREEEPDIDDPVVYWLLDRGWEIDEERMKKKAGEV